MATFVKYTAAIEPLLEGMDVGSNSWKLALANTVNAADTSFVAGTTDLTTGSGYTQGGITCTTSSATQSGGTYTLNLTPPGAPQWSFSGAITFRYVILYNGSTNQPVGYWDYGSGITTANGDTFTISFPGSVLSASIA